MPIYEYECPKCGKRFEEWGKAAESHKNEPCPVCGASSPRVMSRTSFVLKGDGWYVSDYGYRKGISEETGVKSEPPAKAAPAAPAKQADKSLAKAESPKIEAPKADAPKAQAAAKPEAKAGSQND